MISTRHRFFAALSAAAMLLAACGGGGSGSAPAPNPDPNPGGGGDRGITGTGVAIGPITGFNSVIVNGVEYNTDTATFTKDGVESEQIEFEVGEFVVVTGTIDDSTKGTAETVSFEDNVEGPVSSVEDAAVTPFFVVLGQTVYVSPTTSFDDSCPATLAELVNVPAVEVSGAVKDDGSIEASRVQCKAIAGELEVTGKVTNLDTVAMTFQINALVVDYGTVPAPLDNFPTPGVINENDPVEAKGTTIDANGRLVATRVEYKGGRFANDDGVHAEIEGFITDFESATDFYVSGVRVKTDGSTTYEGGAAGDLGPNLKVEVEGEFDTDGFLLATKVQFKRGTNIRVTGLIDSREGSTFTVLDIPITTDGLTTRFEDKSAADKSPLYVTDLMAGQYVEVRGQEFPAESGQIAAELVERDDPRSRTELRGFVEVDSVVRPRLTILGVTVETDEFTIYRNAAGQPMDPDLFWDAVAPGGVLVDVRGDEMAVSTLYAEELQLEAE